MDWRFEDKISVLSNIYGLIYYFLTDELIGRFGDEGYDCAYDALVKYGHFRGGLLRARNQKMGCPINVRSISEHYDLPKDDRSLAKRLLLEDEESKSEYYTCQFSDIWKLLEGVPQEGVTRIGKLYCDAFHQAMWEGYRPELTITIEKMITKGDDRCTFHTTMAEGNAPPITVPGIPPMEELIQRDWRFEDPVSALSNIYAFLYYFIGREALDRFGQAGDEAVCAAVRKYGLYRGDLLAQEHKRRGLSLNVKSFFENYDLPTDQRTTRNRTVLTESESISENSSCQFSDIWKLLEGLPMDGNSRLGCIYCEYFHPAMWEGYLPGMELELSKYLTRGDDRCAFHTTLRVTADA